MSYNLSSPTTIYKNKEYNFIFENYKNLINCTTKPRKILIDDSQKFPEKSKHKINHQNNLNT